jgi:hypothetical protein
VRRGLCEQCGAPQRVAILVGYADGGPVRRSLCLECADAADAGRVSGSVGPTRRRPTMGSLLIATGLLVTLFGIVVDLFGVQTNAGFGLKQQAGLLVGALVVTLGAVLRIDILAVSGAILLGLAGLADLCEEVGTPGLGWQQGGAILTGLGFFLAGLLLWHRRAQRSLSGTDKTPMK